VKLIAVTHQTRFREKGKLEIDKEVLTELQDKGVIVLTTTRALAGINRAVRKMLGT